MGITLLLGILPDWAVKYDGQKFHGCFCDPPYHLGFMGKEWDKGNVAFQPNTWKAIADCLYPGAHLVAFGGTRTFHRLACAIEDAGFEIRDTLMWLYGTGFPKSLDVSKAIDRENGVEREDKFEGSFDRRSGPTGNRKCEICGKWLVSGSPCQCPRPQDKPVSDAAKQWEGYGTALKPAWEPIIFARKPIEGTVVANVLKYGCGAINIDGCRVGFSDDSDRKKSRINGLGPVQRFKMCKQIYEGGKKSAGFSETHNPSGRWPANLIHDGSQMIMELFPQSKGQQGDVKGTEPSHTGDENTNCYGEYGRIPQSKRGDSGSAARFFYCAKSSKSERGQNNKHPTVKPLALCEYLARLILPSVENSRLLVPFAGSGSECIGAFRTGWSEIVGVEMEQEYVTMADQRLAELSCQ